MSKPAFYLGRKAAKATARHSVRGAMAKAKREPPRTLTLLAIGVVIGIVVGWVVASRKAASGSDDSSCSGQTSVNA
jgi:hypothetical protein